VLTAAPSAIETFQGEMPATRALCTSEFKEIKGSRGGHLLS